ncbi:MAG TPA: penicillin-binding protein 1A [Alphaproteobacteria bacterium]|nr:penicillin-binding protein 1A [Alphaproteobacteria bacterium]
MIRWLVRTLVLLVLLVVVAVGGAIGVLWHYGRGLPDYRQLATYEPPVMSRVHAGDGSLIAEYAQERRVFVPINAMPKLVIAAFLSAEDKNFYSHPGVDFAGIARAVVQNLMSVGENRRPVGASTITQQVAKNFLLGNEVSLNRKVKEAILAFRIEHVLSKDRILELYLNEIYLGQGSYGVAAAALNYFNKSLDELTVAEAAYLGGLPKAPSNYHPVRQAAAAKARRDWVIGRMEEDGFINGAQAKAAVATPLVMRPASETRVTDAQYFAEEVRRDVAARFGEQSLYRGGLSIRTTVDPKLQAIADKALHDGLLAYDHRHGWHGVIARIDPGEGWPQRLAGVAAKGLDRAWRAAVVLAAEDQKATVGFADGSIGVIPIDQMRWARPIKAHQTVGPQPTKTGEVFKAGDVVAVEPVADQKGVFALRQIPEVNGAIVAIDPHTGRVLAMTGGWSFVLSQYNRATQAYRQPGSSFKPFVYLAALENGFTPSSRILDAPFAIDQGPGLGLWKPGNYGGGYNGPSTLRNGLEKSRNMMTVRVANQIGIDRVAEMAEKFGVVDRLPRQLSMALGAGETTLLRMTTAYAEIVNGGRKITPTLIDRIQDREGKTVYRHDDRTCDTCSGPEANVNEVPVLPDDREQLAPATSVYQMVSMLQGVVQRGTGASIGQLGIPLGGKTGTTNDSNDTWFIGFSPNLAVGVFIGFDTPRSLGQRETGASVSVPVFKEFMGTALKNKPAVPFRVPPGIRLVRVNATTGLLARAGERGTILEAFKPGTEPTGREGVLDGSDGGSGMGVMGGGFSAIPGTDGLY